MILTSLDNKLIPEGVQLIGIHADSPKSHIDRLKKDLANPQFKSPDGTPIVAIDYETYELTNMFRLQYLEVETEEYFRKKDLFEKSIVKSKPTPPSDTKDLPFDYHNIMVAGMGVCANEKRAFYINLGHKAKKGFMPVVPNEETLSEQFKLKENIRIKQKNYLKIFFDVCPEGTEYIAHNANFEYRVSMSNGFDFLWENQTRYRGGLICTFLMSKLFKFDSRSLKNLVRKIFRFDQPEYMEAIAHTHLTPMIKSYLHHQTVKHDPKFFDRAVVGLVKSIKFNATITFQHSMDSSFYYSIFGTNHEVSCKEFKKDLIAMIKEVVENYRSMHNNTLEETLPYAGQDPWWTLKLFVTLAQRATKTATKSKMTKNLWDYYRKVDHPIIRTVADMSHRGMKIDSGKVVNLQDNCREKEKEYRKRFRNAAWRDFKTRFPALLKHREWAAPSLVNRVNNYTMGRARSMQKYSLKPIRPTLTKDFNSLLEVKKFIGTMDALNATHQKILLFDILMYPVLKLTEKGGISLDKNVLPRYEAYGETAGALLDLRKVTQIYGLYARPYERLVHPETGRVHGVLVLSGADTGRFTMKAPNLQQMSKFASREVEQGLKIRELIIPSSDDRVLLAPDFSQIELRVMAMASKDRNMMECYTGDKDGNFIDIHTKTNQFIFSRELSRFQVGTEEYKKNAGFYRRVSKMVNFLSQYGGGARTLLENLLSQKMEFTENDCQRFIDGFYKAYPRVEEFNENHGGVEAAALQKALTFLGRPRFIDDYDSSEHWKVLGAQRRANNHRIQGTAGDVMKVTMARIFWSDYLKSLGVIVLLTVHDELVLSVPKVFLAKSLKFIVDAYTKYYFNVPIRTSLDAGYNFGDLIGLDETADASIPWEKVPDWCEEITGIEVTEDDKKTMEVSYDMDDETWIN